MNVDKHKSLADDRPVKNSKLTNLAFNSKDPVILLGDTFGGINLMKLSPNLWKRGPEIKKEVEGKKEPAPLTPKQIDEYEREKMESLLVLLTKWEK